MKKVSSLAKEKSVKAEAAKKAVVKEEPAKAETVKTEEFKQEKFAEAETVAEAKEEKKPVEKKTVEKKPVVKKAAEKKEAVAVKEEIFVQFGNREVFTADVVERVKAAYAAEGHAADSIEKVRVYIKPEENMIYYVVNDEYASGISLF